MQNLYKASLITCTCLSILCSAGLNTCYAMNNKKSKKQQIKEFKIKGNLCNQICKWATDRNVDALEKVHEIGWIVFSAIKSFEQTKTINGKEEIFIYYKTVPCIRLKNAFNCSKIIKRDKAPEIIKRHKASVTKVVKTLLKLAQTSPTPEVIKLFFPIANKILKQQLSQEVYLKELNKLVNKQFRKAFGNKKGFCFCTESSGEINQIEKVLNKKKHANKNILIMIPRTEVNKELYQIGNLCAKNNNQDIRLHEVNSEYTNTLKAILLTAKKNNNNIVIKEILKFMESDYKKLRNNINKKINNIKSHNNIKHILSEKKIKNFTKETIIELIEELKSKLERNLFAYEMSENIFKITIDDLVELRDLMLILERRKKLYEDLKNLAQK